MEIIVLQFGKCQSAEVISKRETWMDKGKAMAVEQAKGKAMAVEQAT